MPGTAVPAVAGSRLQVANPPPPPPQADEFPEEAAMAANSFSQRGPNWIGISLSIVSVSLVLIGGLMYWNNKRQGKSVVTRPEEGTFSKSKRVRVKSAVKEDDEEPTAKTSAAAPSPKSIDDLKVSTITLQRTPGSALVYAVGTVRNDSDQQRFGVRIELDLFDNAGKRIGPAKDYVGVIEPHKDWRFRALVPLARTVTAKVAKITEQE
jgi:hypothetical protein